MKRIMGAVVLLGLSGCVSMKESKRREDAAFSLGAVSCNDQVIRLTNKITALSMDVEQKNARLFKFNQINLDGSLRRDKK